MIRVRFIIGTVTNLVSFIDEYSLEETPQMGDFVLLNKITYEVEKRIWQLPERTLVVCLRDCCVTAGVM